MSKTATTTDGTELARSARGLEGAQRSVETYKSVLSELSIKVEEQFVDGDRVTSRFVVEGSHRGRRVRFNGITISRFENGLIVEDWSVTDTLGMLRQLGLWRSGVPTTLS